MGDIKIVKDKIPMSELSHLAKESFIDYVKVVVDVRRQAMAIGGSMHADAEDTLLKDGSAQEDLWGVNIFPEKQGNERIEYTSLINIRPRQNNRSMEIQDDEIRIRIAAVVNKFIVEP